MQTESSIGSAGAAPPPAPSAPAAASPAPPPSPSAAATPVATAAVAPGVPAVNEAVASATPGALPSESERPKTLAEAQALYQQRLAAGEGAQPEAAPAEAQPTPTPTPEVVEPEPIEAAAEEAEPVEPVEAAPVEEPVPAEIAGDDDYLERVLTAEEIETQFNRRITKKERADFAQRETHRGELLKQINDIGGEIGVKLSSAINPIIWAECPFDETKQPAEATKWWDGKVNDLFDQILLPENAGAVRLFDQMGKTLVNTQLQEADCGHCQTDGNKPNPQCTDHVPMGKEFASNMISEEWGKKADGTAFDFRGKKPLELVDLLLRAAQTFTKDEDGNEEPLINLEFIEGELEGNAKSQPSERELALQRENEELRQSTTAERQAKEAEQTREREQVQAQYKTQALGFVSKQVMRAVTPLATKANWAAIEGEDGPQAQEKRELGELIADHVNMRLMGPAGATTLEYQAVLDMIENKTAFDLQTGHPTPRFLLKLQPLETKAKALFNRKLTALSPRLKFTAEKSRNAQLVKQNGSKAGAPPAAAAPPLAVAPKPQSERPLTAVEKLAQVERDYYDNVARQKAQVGVL